MNIFKKDTGRDRYWAVIKPDGGFNVDRIFRSEKDALEDMLYAAFGYDVQKALKDNQERKTAAIKLLQSEGYRVSELLIKPYP